MGLIHVIFRIGQRRKYYPIQAVLQAVSAQIYRPAIYAIDRVGRNGPICAFNVNFAEDVPARDTSALPQESSGLAMGLHFAFKFRCEVLEKFAGQAITIDDIERLDAFNFTDSFDKRGETALKLN